MTNEDRGACGACGAPASLKCTACGNAYYCRKEHQKKHWKIHKRECCPIREKNDPQQGRYLVASRDIPAGQLVLKEKPMALGPPAISTAYCLGCLRPITNPDFLKCPGCFWPLCSPACAQSPLHLPECGYLATDAERQGPPSSLNETPRYDVVLLLRCLALRSARPEAWKIIESMVSHHEKRREEQEPYHMTTVKFVSDILKEVCSEETAHHVRGAIITNAINIRGPEGQILRGLYPKVYLLNHSCQPNVTLRSDIYSTLYINAATDIKKGDPLVFSYVSSGAPLWQRQEELKTIYNFTCSCKRCADPTELATYFSNPRCSKCPEGFLEPSTNYETPWKCPKCGLTRDLEEIIKETDEFVEKIKDRCSTFTEDNNLLQEVTQIFHPKHYAWLTAAQTILAKLGNNTGRETLSMKRDLWQSVVQLFFKLEPGTTRRRGVSMYHSSCAEFDLIKAEEAEGKFSSREYHTALTNVLYQLDLSREILAIEPPDSFEKRWIKLVEKEKANVNTILEKLEKKN